jgi:hypothetical protein
VNESRDFHRQEAIVLQDASDFNQRRPGVRIIVQGIQYADDVEKAPWVPCLSERSVEDLRALPCASNVRTQGRGVHSAAAPASPSKVLEGNSRGAADIKEIAARLEPLNGLRFSAKYLSTVTIERPEVVISDECGVEFPDHLGRRSRVHVHPAIVPAFAPDQNPE